jgi:hypothetical protein
MARTGQPLELACERWLFSVKVFEFLREHHHNNILIRYEELLRHPEAVLARICGFLGVEYDAGMLTGTQNPKMRAEYSQVGFDLTKLGLDNVPEGCVELIRDGLIRVGYL